MDPAVIRQWQSIFRDTLIVVVGAFILLYETMFARIVDWHLIAAALTCFGLPPALRVDLRKRGEKEED